MRDESSIPLLNILLGGVGHALLRSIMSAFLYLVAGALGLVASWLIGLSMNRRLFMNGYPIASRQMVYIGTVLHALLIAWAYFGLSLSPLPIWWPN